MSDYELKRINALPEASAINDSDVFAIDSAAGTKKVAWETLKGEVDADISEAVSNKADKDGTYPDMAVGSVLGTNTVTDREPYFLRPAASIGDREFDTLVGGSLGWNQLCNGSSVTVESGHKYYMIKGGTKSVGASDGTAITGLTSGTDIVIDLTTLFGSTIADYIYSLEQATAGAGVSWFRQYFGKDYYPYSAPTLKSVKGLTAHEMVGFNQWDEEWEVGYIDGSGNNTSSTVNIRSKNYIPVLPNVTYYLRTAYTTVVYCPIFFYDSEKNFISANLQQVWNRTITTPSNASYMRFYMNSAYGTTYNHDICINLSDASKNGTYEPYVKHTYPLDSTWVGMGIPKLDSSNKLYFDGDRYASDGTVTERYGIRAYQSGDESLADAITDGTNTVYKLTTPTTSTATPFTSPQIVDPDGTEEYVTSGLVPVGHETEYVENLADKLTDIPDLPTTAGNYHLAVTVDGGTPSYAWVADE